MTRSKAETIPIEKALEEQLKGDVRTILNEEFAIGCYAIEGEETKRSQDYVFQYNQEQGKIYQFCVVSSKFHGFINWYRNNAIENIPDSTETMDKWRDVNKRFMKLIKERKMI